MKYLYTAALLFIFTSNTIAQLGVESEEIHTIPQLGKASTVDVGENIIIIEHYNQIRALFCADEIKYDKNGKIKTVKISDKITFKDTYPADNPTFDRYCSLYQCLCVDPRTNQIVKIQDITKFILTVKEYPIVSEKPVYLSEKEVTQIPIPTRLKQQFIYNGKSGSTVKFTYREFVETDDPTSRGFSTKKITLSRDAFTQDVQYDLSESRIIGFKGAKFEIINATNSTVEYKILSAFNQN